MSKNEDVETTRQSGVPWVVAAILLLVAGLVIYVSTEGLGATHDTDRIFQIRAERLPYALILQLSAVTVSIIATFKVRGLKKFATTLIALSGFFLFMLAWFSYSFI